MKKLYLKLKKQKINPNTQQGNLYKRRIDNDLSLRRLSPSSGHHDDIPDKPRRHQKQGIMTRMSFTKRRVMALVIVLLVSGVLFGLLFVQSAPKIVLIEPTGYNYRSRSIEQYNQVVSSVIKSSLSNRFKVSVSLSQIDQTLRNAFPEINKTVENFSLLNSSPTIYIQLKAPAVIDTINGRSYALSSQGYVLTFVNQHNYQQFNALPVVDSAIDYSNVAIGSQILTSSTVNFIQIVYYGLKQQGISMLNANLVPKAEEMDVYLKNLPYYIKFNLHNNTPRLQLGTYLATRAKLQEQGIVPHQYIDVRVPGRSYYQ